MIKDLLGEILNAKKGKALEVIIKIEPEDEMDEKKQGLAPELEAEKTDDKESDKLALMNGEEGDMEAKMDKGVLPRNLAERAKMKLMK